MDISKDKNWFLFFGVGILWAIVSSRKVYAPNINNKTSAPLPTLDPNRECPEGKYKEYIACCEAMTPNCERCKENSRRLGGFMCLDEKTG